MTKNFFSANARTWENAGGTDIISIGGFSYRNLVIAFPYHKPPFRNLLVLHDLIYGRDRKPLTKHCSDKLLIIVWSFRSVCLT